MKNYYLFIAALFISALSFSQPLLNENFNYGSTSGDLINYSGDWIEHFSGIPNIFYNQGEGLSMTNYPSSGVGGAAEISNSADGQALSRTFATVNSGIVYMGALVKLTTSTLEAGAGGSFFLHLNTDNNNVIRARVFVKDNGSGSLNFGIISQGTNAQIAWGTTPFSKTDTHLIVASYEISSGKSRLYVLNAPVGNEPGTFEAEQTFAGVVPISTVAIRQRSNGPAGLIDGIRIATSWSDIMTAFTGPTLTLTDAPASGGAVNLDPELAEPGKFSVGFVTTNFNMSNDAGSGTGSGGDGFIKWDMEDTSTNNIVDSGNIFAPEEGLEQIVENLAPGKTYLLTGTLYQNDGVTPISPAVEYTLTINIGEYVDVANLAALRGMPIGDTNFYRVLGPVTNTYSRGSTYDNEQYFQDDSAGIWIVDENGEIDEYAEGDVLTNIRGHLEEIATLLYFVPTEDSWGTPIYNKPIIPQVVTTQNLIDNIESYESELVMVKDATFQTTGNFAALSNYPINDGSGGNLPLRTWFPEADYIVNSDMVPAGAKDIISLVIPVNGNTFITPRSRLDILDPNRPMLNITDGPPNGSFLENIDPGTAENASVLFNVTNFTMSSETGSCTGTGGEGFIKWTLTDISDNSLVNSGCVYQTVDDAIFPGMLPGNTYKYVAELVDNTGTSWSPASTYCLIINVGDYIDVANLAQLRMQTPPDPNVFYRVIGQVTFTYHNADDDNNLHFFQDNTAGIVVSDEDGFLESYDDGDVIQNIRGYLKTGSSGELILETSKISYGTALSNLPKTPETITIQALKAANFEAYESELIRIANASFTSPTGQFALNTTYAISDGSGGGTINFLADFPNADYIFIPTDIPSGSRDLVVLVRHNSGEITVTARSLEDLSLDIGEIRQDSFKLYPNPTSLGYINILIKNQSKLDVSVFDLLGKEVITQTLTDGQLDVANLTTGMYILRIMQDDLMSIKKLVIE